MGTWGILSVRYTGRSIPEGAPFDNVPPSVAYFVFPSEIFQMNIPRPYIFTSESVSEGHPDKVCDQISDAILDACLRADPGAHVACETAAGPDFVANLGEITCAGFEAIDKEAIVRGVVRDIGYDRPAEGFDAATLTYLDRLHGQSPDINQGVSRGSDEAQGAGDQGMMFGYATDETPEFMPAPLALSHLILRRLSALRKDGTLPWLRPDAKTQLSVLYRDGRPARIDTVVVSHMTTEEGDALIRREMPGIVRDILAPYRLVDNDTIFHINPTGRFITGGPNGDSGLTGRKIIVDTYGGASSHGGGAFSGKDPSKVDRSAAYYARYVAKNIVAAGLAARCNIQVSYAIGVATPTSICVHVDTEGTARVSEERIEDFLMHGGLFDFRPGMITRALRLRTPEGWSYRDTAAYGHFGRTDKPFPWEALDKVDALRDAFRK